MKPSRPSPTRQRSKSKVSIDKKQPICITIQLKGGSEPVALSENFVKVLEKEYAVKYLELMHVAPTAKNIQRLLKDVPLSVCEIKAGWHGSGWLADVIHIYPTKRNKGQGVNLVQEGGFAPETMTEEGKTMQRDDSGLSPAHFKRQEATAKSDEEGLSERHYLILDADAIKKRYLYPFFVVGESAESVAIAEQETAPTVRSLPGSTRELFDSKIFQFPFDRITVPSAMIKEVLQPITVRLEAVMEDLRYISAHFPLEDFQVAIESQQKTIALEAALQTACSEKSARLLGLLAHFCYFTVFGHIQNVPLSPQIQHQLFTQIILLFHENENMAKGGRLVLNLPMLLLILRIEIEGVFKLTYPRFFEGKTQGEVALQKIQSVLTTLLDPDYYYSRLSFLESGLDAVSLAAQASKQMKGKYYSISALVKSLFPNPSHPRTRALLARKDALEGRLDNLVKTGAQIAGTMPLLEGRLNYYQQSEPWKTADYLDVKSRAQLFSVSYM